MGCYRYGFQGQERDDEVKGAGNSYDFTFRMHDPRLGRFFAVDPLTAKYPHYSPYSFSGNKVILFAELEGGEEIVYYVKEVKAQNGETVFETTGNEIAGENYNNGNGIFNMGSGVLYVITKLDGTEEHKFIKPVEVVAKPKTDIKNNDEKNKWFEEYGEDYKKWLEENSPYTKDVKVDEEPSPYEDIDKQKKIMYEWNETGNEENHKTDKDGNYDLGDKKYNLKYRIKPKINTHNKKLISEIYVAGEDKTVKRYETRTINHTKIWYRVEQGNTVGAQGDSLYGGVDKDTSETNVIYEKEGYYEENK